MLLFAAGVAVAMAAFVVVVGQDRAAKICFASIAGAAAAIALGLWAEVTHTGDPLLAARVNMSAALVLAGSAIATHHWVDGLPLRRSAVTLLAIAAVANLATVWLTDAYFTGRYIDYAWGGYVEGDPRFVINPLLVSLIIGYIVVSLGLHYRKSPPIARNRTRYVFAAYVFLGLSALDYLPHFGVDLFGGSVSSVTIPLFLGTYGYACLRYRLADFGPVAGRASGWVLTAIAVVAAYGVTLEVAMSRLDARSGPAHAAAAAVALLVFAAIGQRLPAVIERLLGGGEDDHGQAIDDFSREAVGLLEEDRVRERLLAVCTSALGASEARLVEPETVRAVTSGTAPVELEVERRGGRDVPASLAWADVLLPLRAETAGGLEVIGGVALGPRRDARMYSTAATHSLAALGSVYTMASASARAADELRRRLHLDRFLSPQLVARVMADGGAVTEHRRAAVTVFFSDLCNFTSLADRIDPVRLATVLDGYLSAMGDIALGHGGTIDKFVGDAIMVLFGAPVAMSPGEQATRALTMARAMYARLDDLNRTWCEQGLVDAPLACRMGMSSGEAIVGSFGSDRRSDYTAIGSVVNLASRLESVCTPGAIAISRATWALLSDDERAAYGSALERTVLVKGYSDPVAFVQLGDQITIPLASRESQRVGENAGIASGVRHALPSDQNERKGRFSPVR